MTGGRGRFRVALYAYSDTGADGILQSTYTFVEERWASWRDSGSSWRIPTGSAENVEMVEIVLDWEAAPTHNGLFMIQNKGEISMYRITAIHLRPQLRKQVVAGVYVDVETLNIVGPSS